MRIRVAWAIALLVVIAAVACSRDTTPTPTPEPTTATAIVASPTETPVPTSTIISPPTRTPVPTIVLTPIPTSTPAVLPTSTPVQPSPTATPVVPTPTATPTETPEDSVLEKRLDRLVEELEAQRQEEHIPGMALAVVMDDEIILTKGFGFADLDNQIPVTSETIFPIGSSTKAFTSALIGMLVDEGVMTWDDPVTDYIPYFDLQIDTEDENAEVTLRDMLSHRTGYTRMGVLAGASGVPIEEILQTAPNAEPWTGFRQSFYYNNIMYLAAGVSAGVAEGITWDALITERILAPLGMDNTTTSVAQVRDNPLLSLGYTWDIDLQVHDNVELHSVDNIGPAGSMNSDVLDMAQWLRLLLGGGEYEGQRLISEEQLTETWMAQIPIAPQISYGMGWFIDQWEGQVSLYHGGNVPGFSSQVGLLPESGIGFVLLTNTSVASLQNQSVNIVWNALLGPFEEGGTGLPTEEYDPYLGEYIANFGPFENEKMTVLVKNNKLAVDVPGQTVYELEPPDQEGKWYFSITDTIAVSFERDDQDNVVAMRMYQGGFEFELPREGVEVAPEIPLESLEKYLGNYRSDDLGITVEILVQNNRLAIDFPGETAYELFPPDEEGIWVFRVFEDFTLRFDESEDEQVNGLIYDRAGSEYYMHRLDFETTPALDEFLAIRQDELRGDIFEDMGTIRITGTVRALQSGVEGTVTVYSSGVNKYRIEIDYGKFGKTWIVLNGDEGWTDSTYGEFDDVQGRFLEQLKMGHPAAGFGNLEDYYDVITVLREDTLDEREVFVVRLERENLPPAIAYFDAETGDLLRSEGATLVAGYVGIPITSRFEDFREVNGLRIPFTSISINEATGRSLVQYEQIEMNLEVDEELFVLTP